MTRTSRWAAALTLGTSLALPAPAAVAAEVTPARAGGVDRYSTASIAMNLVAFPGGTGTAVLATGEDFPDALAAAGLAGQAGAALVLADPDEPLQTTGVALNDLGVENLYVLGGDAAISPEVLDAYASSGRAVTRLGGADRYETAALVAREVARLGPLAQVGGEPAAFLTTGEDFPDALTAGAPAAAAAAPVLLTRGDRLPAATAAALRDLGIGHVWIVGGDAAVAPAVQEELARMGIATERLHGRDRQGTAVAVARAFVGSGLLGGGTVTLARGDAFPDALVGGVTAAATDGPVLLTRSPDSLGMDTRSYLADPAAPVSVVRAMGGEAAITPAALDAAVHVVGTGPSAPQSWILAPQEPYALQPGGVADFELLNPPGGQPLPSPLHLALFDCRLTDALGEDRSFSDRDGDGLADGLGSTEAGSAAIAVVNGEDIADTDALSVDTTSGQLTFRLASAAPDCAVAVVFDDRDQNGFLDVDADGQPTEPYNVGLARWQ